MCLGGVYWRVFRLDTVVEVCCLGIAGRGLRRTVLLSFPCDFSRSGDSFGDLGPGASAKRFEEFSL